MLSFRPFLPVTNMAATVLLCAAQIVDEVFTRHENSVEVVSAKEIRYAGSDSPSTVLIHTCTEFSHATCIYGIVEVPCKFCAHHYLYTTDTSLETIAEMVLSHSCACKNWAAYVNMPLHQNIC